MASGEVTLARDGTAQDRDRWDAKDLQRVVRAAQGCALELGDDAALFLLSLNLAERAGWLEAGCCARWAALGAGERDSELNEEVLASLRERSGGALPLGGLPRVSLNDSRRDSTGEGAAAMLLCEAPVEALPIVYEALQASSRGPVHRRAQGVYYTPPGVAARVVALAFEHGPKLPARPRVFDCCAGAGIFLLSSARALAARGVPAREAALLCAGSDLDARALAVTRAGLALLAGPSCPSQELAGISLEALDALRRAPQGPAIDLLITNPPYGHAPDARERERLARRYPALRGGEIDLYAAFILRALELVRPGGTAALLVPDTWMTNARAAPLRAAVLEQAELCAVADLGKPFAAAKDTRVQALVLARRDGLHANDSPRDASRPIFAARLAEPKTNAGPLLALAPLEEPELYASLSRGWQPYRSRGERALAEAMDAASVPLEQLCLVGYGLRTGDNPRHVARGEVPLDALGLVGGEEIEPFRLRRKPKWLRDATPEQLKLAKKQQGIPRVAVQRIRTNAGTPWSRWLEAAPIPPALVCLDSLSTLAALPGSPADLLWALLGLFGSVALNRYHRLRTTDVNVKPSALRELPAPRLLADADELTKIVNLSKQRHLEQESSAAHLLERAIDAEVYRLYALDPPLIEEAERGFWGERYESERALLPL